jgi:hypothetical protein
MLHLVTEELQKLSNDVADAYHLSLVHDDGPPPQVLLSLLALCNHERVMRTLRPRHASPPVTAVARQSQSQHRPAPNRAKTSRPSPQ